MRDAEREEVATRRGRGGIGEITIEDINIIKIEWQVLLWLPVVYGSLRLTSLWKLFNILFDAHARTADVRARTPHTHVFVSN